MPKPKTTAFSTRLSAEDRKTINCAAMILGCSPSQFIREAAVASARKVSWDPEHFVLERVRVIMKALEYGPIDEG